MIPAGCWRQPCPCWPICACSARCPAARWSSRPPRGTGTSSWPCRCGTPTASWPWTSVRETPMSDRFKPTRAGVINVWDYVDEEWVFADGRLALRGHNGSGKTKALEVLFPFVLDGVADSRRLDPFSGENRTMKSNLLYRGQEAEYGYIWMEFVRTDPAETVTLVIGLRAHRNRDGVKTSFFVTGKRLGADFGLLSADSRPLTERQLKLCWSQEPGTGRPPNTATRSTSGCSALAGSATVSCSICCFRCAARC